MTLYLLFKLKKKLFILSIIIICNNISSCGLKTPPQNIPLIKSKSTIKNFNVIQKGHRIRISWEISEIDRINALYKFYKDPFDNESERNKIFGEKNIHYQELKKRLPKFTIDLICKWYQDKFENIVDREKALMKWYYSQFKNNFEKDNAFTKLNDNQNLQEYFLIKEMITPIHCRNCKPELNRNINVNFSSKFIIREGDNFYFYIEMPKKDLYFREYELSHHGPYNEILTPVKKFKLRKTNLFPKVPTPTYKIIKIENEKKTLQFSFGNLVIKESILTDNLMKHKKDNSHLLKIKKTDPSQKDGSRTFTLRISWPTIPKINLKRFSGSGDYFEEKKDFEVNLYRTRTPNNWSESPINSISNSKNYFLDKIKLYLNDAKSKKILNLQPKNLPQKTPFYIDLKGQNSDTWLYKITLVDGFGNESLASETVTVKIPKNNINGLFFSDKAGVPYSN